MHFLCEPVDLSSCIDKDHCLRDCQGLVQVAECVQLPLLVGGQRDAYITRQSVHVQWLGHHHTPKHHRLCFSVVQLCRVVWVELGRCNIALTLILHIKSAYEWAAWVKACLKPVGIYHLCKTSNTCCACCGSITLISFGLLLELHTLTQATCSYALLPIYTRSYITLTTIYSGLGILLPFISRWASTLKPYSWQSLCQEDRVCRLLPNQQTSSAKLCLLEKRSLVLLLACSLKGGVPDPHTSFSTWI